MDIQDLRHRRNELHTKMAGQLDVRTGHKVESVRFVNNLWHLDFEDSQSISADQLLMTSPVPQTIALLEAGQVELNFYQKVILV